MSTTFRELIPGDIIYFIDLNSAPKVINDRFSSYPAYLDGALRNKIEIILADDNYLKFSNGTKEYQAYRIFLNLPNHHLDKTIYHSFDSKGKWYAFYSNFEAFESDLKEVALMLLAAEDEKVESAKRLRAYNQETIRQVFWDFLNPTK